MKHYSWNPWHGCKKCSDGCQNCYVYYLDKIRERDASNIQKSKTAFNDPVKCTRTGEWKLQGNAEVYTCFTSDFFVEEADEWREDAWEMIRKRQDLLFLIPTKRIHRFSECMPADWGTGYNNVIIAVTTETQKAADTRLPMFMDLPIKHKEIFICPILEYVDLKPYLNKGTIELVSVGGESYEGARECNFDWVREIYHDCRLMQVPFTFHQTGSLLRVNGRIYRIPREKEYSQARKAMNTLFQSEC